MQRTNNLLQRTGALVLGASLALLPTFTTGTLYAATNQINVQQARVSFTFDDGFASTYTQAAPALAAHGLTGTNYVATGCIDKQQACIKNVASDSPYMTWQQVQALQNQYGWEIGAHSTSHPEMSTLSAAQLTNELSGSKAALAAHGIAATAFATPFGDYNPTTLAAIAKYFSSHRGFHDTGLNSWPANSYLLRVKQLHGGISLETAKGYVQEAIQANAWLIFALHDIAQNPSSNPDDYEWGTSQLEQLAAYVATQNIAAINVSQGLVGSTTNLLANGNFAAGITNGWTTDAPAQITANKATNGSYPDPTYSIALAATTRNIHLFSPRIAVDPKTTYLLKSFLNATANSGGNVFYYIDEYDANGNWVSGQYKVAEPSVFVENITFSYKPSSAAVSKASLQIGVTANSGIKAYVANAQWFPLTTQTVSNLFPAATQAGSLANGWTTDKPANVTSDSAGHGSPAEPLNSVKLTAPTTGGNAHLFSPRTNVDPSKQYQVSSYLNLTQAAGIGYYIDEYDANGNWISGQYKLTASAAGAATYNFGYIPSSASVAKASLQIIVPANSGALGYIDDLALYQL